MAAWRLDGNPRPPRQWTGDQNGPWPTPAEPRCFLLPALQPSALHVVQGRRCGMGQRTAQQGRHVLWPGRLAARRALGAAPARSLTALAQRRGGSSGPKPLRHRRHGRAARQRTTPATTSCACRLSSRSSCRAPPTGAVGLLGASRRPPPIDARPGVGCCRPWGACPARALRWPSAGRRRSSAGRRCPWRHHGPPRRATSGGGWSMATAAASGVALSKTATACGRRASALW